MSASRTRGGRLRWPGLRIRITAAVPAAVAAIVAVSCAAAPPEVTVDDPELEVGRDIYARNCASCHGSDGGGGVGRKLSEGTVVDTFPNIKDQIDLIANGKGSMPSYTGRLTGQQMEAVARYTREVL